MIIGKIRREGPISFRDYMDMVLYEPGHGYYASPGEKIGKNGDFYTSPTLTPLFGEMIARQLQEMWIILDKAPFTIVECGAGTGALCRSGPVTGKEKEFVLQTLLLDMGTKFKVLIQQKGLRRPLLSGLRFRQPLV